MFDVMSVIFIIPAPTEGAVGVKVAYKLIAMQRISRTQ
jgi:hypothetical protein